MVRKLSDGSSRLLLPRRGGKPFSIARLPRLLQDLKITDVAHGVTSIYGDSAVETTDYRREVIEAALAQAVANQTEAAYARSDLFERQRRLMDKCALYLNRAHHRPADTGTAELALAPMIKYRYPRLSNEWRFPVFFC